MYACLSSLHTLPTPPLIPSILYLSLPPPLNSSCLRACPYSSLDCSTPLTPPLPLSLSMASNSLQPIHYYHHHNSTESRRNRRHSLDSSLAPQHPPSPSAASLFLRHLSAAKPRNVFSSLSTFSSTTTSTGSSTTTSAPITFDVLRRHLCARDLRQADEETRRLLIQLAGEPAQKRGYVFFSEVQFIAKEDLRAIDELWKEHSDNRYGYSVQRRIWKKVKGDFTRFFLKVGWMKKLENSEVDQYNYRSFPGEFMWEITDETPEGHLPLTNALRGTQLLSSILSHPAFAELDQEEKDTDNQGYNSTSTAGDDNSAVGAYDSNGNDKKPLSKRVYKPDYSF